SGSGFGRRGTPAPPAGEALLPRPPAGEAGEPPLPKPDRDQPEQESEAQRAQGAAALTREGSRAAHCGARATLGVNGPADLPHPKSCPILAYGNSGRSEDPQAGGPVLPAGPSATPA